MSGEPVERSYAMPPRMARFTGGAGPNGMNNSYAESYHDQDYDDDDEEEEFVEDRELEPPQRLYKPVRPAASTSTTSIEASDHLWDDLGDLNDETGTVFNYDPELSLKFDVTLDSGTCYTHHHISKDVLKSALKHHLETTGASYSVKYLAEHMIEVAFVSSFVCKVDGADRQPPPTVLFVTDVPALNGMTYICNKACSVFASHSGIKETEYFESCKHCHEDHPKNRQMSTLFLSGLLWHEDDKHATLGHVLFPKRSAFTDTVVQLRKYSVTAVREAAAKSLEPSLQSRLWSELPREVQEKYQDSYFVWPVKPFRGFLLPQMMAIHGAERDVFAHGISFHVVTAGIDSTAIEKLSNYHGHAGEMIEKYRSSKDAVTAARRYAVTLNLKLVVPLPSQTPIADARELN